MIKFEFRDMNEVEFAREQKAFDEHSLESDNPTEEQERFGFVATENGIFVGCSSGLAQKWPDGYSQYFYLSDLLVEKGYRRKGIGKILLANLEDKVKTLGIKYVWTWTAEYEGEQFYLKQGYSIFTRQNNFYQSGHSRVGLIKEI